MLVLGHTWAGGSLPSVAWIALMALIVFGAGVLVLQERVATTYAIVGLVATQLLLHGWLTALTVDPHAGHAGHAGPAGLSGHGAAHPAFDVAMIGVHVGAALVTALVWKVRAQATDIIVAWSEPDRLAPLGPLDRVSAAVLVAVAATHAQFVIVDAPRRGPPRPFVPVPA